MKEISFGREVENLVVRAEEKGVIIMAVGFWTVAIPQKDAIEYVKTINHHPGYKGFFEFDDPENKIILAHGDARLTLSQQEAYTLIKLIKTAYNVTE